jgi:hypothetical protein
VLGLTHAKREQDVHEAANHGDGRHPCDQQNGRCAVVVGGQGRAGTEQYTPIETLRFVVGALLLGFGLAPAPTK